MRYCLFGGKETSVSKKTDSSWHYGWDLTYAIHCTLPSDFASIILPGAVHSPFSCVKNALTLVSLDLLVSWECGFKKFVYPGMIILLKGKCRGIRWLLMMVLSEVLQILRWTHDFIILSFFLSIRMCNMSEFELKKYVILFVYFKSMIWYNFLLWIFSYIYFYLL